MIAEAAALAATAAAFAYALRTLRDRRAPPPGEEPKASEEEGPRGLKVGDVLLHGSDEAWLGGMLEGHEEGEFALRLFRTPGASVPWIAQLDAYAEQIAYLNTHDVPAGAVPAELSAGGLRHHLKQRCKLNLLREGEDVPRETSAEFVRLEASAGRVIVVLDFPGERLALAGEVIPRSMLELLPGE